MKSLEEGKPSPCLEVDELRMMLRDDAFLVKRLKKTEPYVGLVKHLVDDGFKFDL